MKFFELFPCILSQEAPLVPGVGRHDGLGGAVFPVLPRLGVKLCLFRGWLLGEIQWPTDTILCPMVAAKRLQLTPISRPRPLSADLQASLRGVKVLRDPILKRGERAN